VNCPHILVVDDGQIARAEETSVNETEYLSQVASLAGLRQYAKQGPWGRKSGSAMGARDGYVTAIGFDRTRNEAKLTILVRFKKVENPETIKATLAQSGALSEKKRGKLAAAGSDSLRWDWKYSFAKPKAEDVAGLANSLVEAIKPIAPGFDGKCEKCRSASTPDLTLLNGVPMYICSSCQQQTHLELDQAAMNYEAITPNYPNGIALGIGAALLGGIAWGLVAYGLHRVFLWGAILIGFAIAWGAVKGTKKVTLFVQVMIPILTIASVILGDAIFYLLTVMKDENLPFTQKLFLAVVAHLWELEKESQGGLFSVGFALVGALVALYQARKPKFKAVFEPLGTPTA
jgi:hypothetical protein